MTLNTIASAMVFLFIGMTLTSHNALYSGSVPWWKAIYDDKRRCQGQLFEKRVSNMETITKKARSLYIPYAGPVLLEFPLLNKGSAFSVEERRNFNLSGCCQRSSSRLKNRPNAPGSSIRGLKQKSISIFTCVTSRIPTKRSFIDWCKTILKR